MEVQTLNELNMHDSGVSDIRVLRKGDEFIVEMDLDYILSYESSRGTPSAPALLRFHRCYGFRGVMRFWFAGESYIIDGETLPQDTGREFAKREFGGISEIASDIRVHRVMIGPLASEVFVASRSVEIVVEGA